ncbi:MAG: cytochrome P450 [Solirubrobacterales bacterium]|nr:cytochrome P450 [Solirubrobacterales bacterium]
MIASSRLPPGPRMPSAVQTLGWWNRSIPFMERCRARYGRRWTLRLLGTPPFVMLSDPEQIRAVFTASADVLHPGEGARILGPIVGERSVLLLDGAEHLEQRKLMLPAFHGERMERLAGLVGEVTEREVASWPRDQGVALHPRLQSLTLEVILRAVFGLEPGERLDLLRARLTEVLDWGARPVGLLPPLQRELGGFGPWARFKELRAEVDAPVYELIAERRADHAERDDLLAMLLDARHTDGSPMSDDELRDELMTLLVAGHETTASQLSWAFQRLARAPDVAARLADEIDREDGAEYLEATIRESLRSRPVLPNVQPRLVKEPIEVGGWEYPPGCCLVANAYLVHHDPELYPDPYVFRPERFLEHDPGTYTWIPFGGGRRRCLGASFALLEMRIVLRAVFAATSVRPAGDGLELSRRRSITLSPRRGAHTVLSARGERVPAAA